MFLASVAACDKTPEIIQWIEVGWIRATHHWRLHHDSRQSDLAKLKTWNRKGTSTPRTINTILSNI